MKSLQSALKEIIYMKQIFLSLPPAVYHQWKQKSVFRVAVIEMVLVVVDMSGCFWYLL